MSLTRDRDLITEGFTPPSRAAGPSSNGESSQGRRERMRALVRRSTRRPVVLLVVLLVLSNAALGILLARSAGDGSATETTKVASRFVVNLLSFRHGTLDADIAEVKADATPAFARRAGGAMGDDEAFRDSLRRAETESEATVVVADTTSSSRTAATVVVVVEQTIRRTGVEAEEAITRVVSVTLVRTSAGWKVDDLRTVGSADA